MKRKSWYLDGNNKQEGAHQKHGKKRNKFLKDGRVDTTTVVFVPNTKGGTLVKKLKEREDKMSELTGFRIRFQEAGGSQLKNLFNTDLGKGNHCGRQPCPPCDMNGERRENCRSKNLVYESRCLVCNPGDLSRKEDIPTMRSGI